MRYTVDENFEGSRMDRFARKNLKDTPLSNIYKMIRTGKIKVNGKKIKENYILKAEDVIDIFGVEESIVEVEFMEIGKKECELVERSNVFENDDIIIINKPGNMVIHKGSEHDYGIIDIYKSYYKNKNIAPVNRIDKATSGLFIAGKSLKALREYSELLRLGDIKKYYYVLVRGKPEKNEFTIISKLRKDEDRVREYSDDTAEEDLKESVTNFVLVKKYEKLSLIEAEIETGRTHQIRVQLAEIGLHIVGDQKYGIPNEKVRKMCLVSYKIVIEKKGINFELEIPEFFKKIIEKEETTL